MRRHKAQWGVANCSTNMQYFCLNREIQIHIEIEIEIEIKILVKMAKIHAILIYMQLLNYSK